MCGIAGIISSNSNNINSWVRSMSKTILHRGPDDSGIWQEGNICLGHQRLSVIDLSTAGCQPMHSHTGRYSIVFNGEIYNLSEIKNNLKNVEKNIFWRGYSDTEVLLTAIEILGIEKTLEISRGMFAFAFWDREDKTLTIVRDRIGEKPIYYGQIANSFIFASELKAFRALPFGNFQIDIDSLSLMLRYGYIPSPGSIYKNVFKLTPGTLLKVSEKMLILEKKTWWSLNKIKKNIQTNIFNGKDIEAVEILDKKLRLATQEQMIADVPLGAMLSGGIDSSLIVSLMQNQSSKPINTFTIGFDDNEYNEAGYAKLVANHLGTNHTELYVTDKDAMNIIPSLPNIYDEPFGDSSQIPTFLVSKLTRKHVTVSLSGDGGDELFGGYNRYLWASTIWQTIKWVPPPLRKLIALAILIIPANKWNILSKFISQISFSKLRVNNYGDKMHKIGEIIQANSKESMYLNIVSQWQGILPFIKEVKPITIFKELTSYSNIYSFEDQMMEIDMLTYLPDDILVKLDRAAMSNSLETRLPFLDTRVMDFAWNIPLDMKIRKGQNKWLLRQVLNKYVPDSLMNRPKQGFSIPLGNWLRGSLRDWAENLLSKKNLESGGFLNSKPIHKIWQQHLKGRNMQHALWNILMFQSWREKWD